MKKMEYKTRQWHEKCFVCCTCKNPIGTKSFIPKEHEIYCAKCYEDKFATKCIKCVKVIILHYPYLHFIIIHDESRFQSSLFSFIFRLSHKEELHIETNHGTVNASHAQIVKNRQLVSVLHPEMISHIVLIVLENFFQNVVPLVANQ